MATLAAEYSLAEQVKRLNPDKTTAFIVECLNCDTGKIIEEAPWIKSNDIWTNKTVRRASLPTIYRRKLNDGVYSSSSTTTEVIDVIEMLETYAKFDKAYIDSFENPAEVRLVESKVFIESMGQSLVSHILYSNNYADPDGMHGLAPRLATIDGEFVINANGTGSDLTSIYVVTWGEDSVYLTYPRNIPNFGIENKDLGETTIQVYDSSGAATGKEYQGYKHWFGVKVGLVVRDPRCIGRVANIETSGATNTFNEDNLITLLENMKVNENTRIYANQTILTQARIALKDKSNVHWVPEQGLGGLPFLTFDGIPVRKIDKSILLNTESAIS